MSPEPVGSTHLRFDDARVIRESMYVVTECCSESRMRSRTSRGVPEWSGGKELYIGSAILAIGTISVLSVLYRDHRRGPGGPPGGPPAPGGHMGCRGCALA